MKEDPTRRDVLKGIAAASALATVPTYGMGSEANAESIKLKEPKEWEGIIPEEVHTSKEGVFVSIEDLMRQEIPTPEPGAILGTDTGLIISKRFHRFWLFKEGKLLRAGPVGTARTDKGMDTPEGLFKISRQEGEKYSSREFPASDPRDPNMAYASFFHPRGIAFHGSTNFDTFKNMDTGVEETFIRLDNSHGCVNALKSDALLVKNTLKKGDRIAVLR